MQRILVINSDGTTTGLPVEPYPFIHTPLVARVDDAVLPNPDGDIPAAVVTGSPFGTDGQADTHTATQVQVSRWADFNIIDHDTGEVADLRSIVITGLTSGTDYYARLRHRGQALGLSLWSAAFAFTAP